MYKYMEGESEKEKGAGTNTKSRRMKKNVIYGACFIVGLSIVFVFLIFIQKVFKGNLVREKPKIAKTSIPVIIDLGHPMMPSKPLKKAEIINFKQCQNNVRFYLPNSLKMWKKQGGEVYLRKKYKSFLNNGSTIVIVGGNMGLAGQEADYLINTFKPKKVIIIEPVFEFYQGIVARFRDNPSVVAHNIGLGADTRTTYAHIKGELGLETSIYRTEMKHKEKVQVNIINATDFFRKIGIGYFNVDFITIDCEGCEYAVLESLTKTSLSKYFKYIHFQIHCPKYFGYNITDPHIRYCEIEERLKRTHSVIYQLKYYQEIWKIKENV